MAPGPLFEERPVSPYRPLPSSAEGGLFLALMLGGFGHDAKTVFVRSGPLLADEVATRMSLRGRSKGGGEGPDGPL